jgi:hypothetical protein
MSHQSTCGEFHRPGGFFLTRTPDSNLIGRFCPYYQICGCDKYWGVRTNVAVGLADSTIRSVSQVEQDTKEMSEGTCDHCSQDETDDADDSQSNRVASDDCRKGKQFKIRCGQTGYVRDP